MRSDSKLGKEAGDNSGTERKTIGFWSRQMQSGRIIQAIRSHPTEARRFFGALPVLRGNIVELSLILEAHKTLKRSDVQLNRTHNRFRERLLEFFRNQNPPLTDEDIGKVEFFKENYAAQLRREAKMRLNNARGEK